jgi:hypothetical protein
MHRPPSKPHPAQRGAVLIWVAFFLLVMLMFIALGIDMAKLMATRTQLQNAADAAALSGASAFGAATGSAVTSIARARAYETAAMNTAFQAAATPVLVDTVNDVIVNRDSMTVRVITRREQSAGTGMVTQFLRVIGLWTLDMRAAATAKAEGGCSLWPIAGRPDPGPDFVMGCTEYTLKYGGGSGTQGSYGALDLTRLDCADPYGCNGSGANAYRCYLRNGFPCCIDSGTCVPREAGNMSGPTEQGIEARFAADTDQRQGICYWKVYPNVLDYAGNGSRVIMVPITGPETGCGYVVQRYAQFFLTRIPGSGNKSFIYGNFLGYGGGPGTTTNKYRVWLIR